MFNKNFYSIQAFCLIIVIFNGQELSVASKTIESRIKRGVDIGDNQRISGVVQAYPGEQISIGSSNQRQPTSKNYNKYDRPIDPPAGYYPEQNGFNKQPIGGSGVGHSSNIDDGRVPNGINIGNRNTIKGGIHQQLEPGSHFGGAVIIPQRQPQSPSSSSSSYPSQNRDRNQGNYGGGETGYGNSGSGGGGIGNGGRLIINGVDVSKGRTPGNVCIGEDNIVNGRRIQSINC